MSKVSDVGFLLIHGLGSNHLAMHPLEQFLTNAGYLVDNIDLPGFNTTPEDLQSIKWLDWINYSQERLNILKDKCTSVYVCGTSLGGALALSLCSVNQDLVGIITLATAAKPFNFISWFLYLFPPIQYFYKWVNVGQFRASFIGDSDVWYGYDKLPVSALVQTVKLLRALRRKLKFIHQPILLLHGINDQLVPPNSMKSIVSKIISNDITTVEILEGGHLVLLDKGSKQALQEIEKWLERKV